MLLYHATRPSKIDSILEKGLLPSIGESGGFDEGTHRTKGVFFADDLDTLFHELGEGIVKGIRESWAIVVVDLPRSEVKRFLEYRRPDGSNFYSYYVTKKVSPESIVEVIRG